MAALLLIRHALAQATGKRLYGNAPGVHLSPEGRAQAAALAERLSGVPIDAIYSSPLERCVETAAAIATGRSVGVETVPDLNEVDYGRWTGRTFSSLRRTATWKRVHEIPSAARFPGGESLPEVLGRVVRACRWVAERHATGTIGVISHGDVIKLALAHFAGMHIDVFQRLQIDPASVSVVAFRDDVPRVLRLNDTGTLADLTRRRRTRPTVRG